MADKLTPEEEEKRLRSLEEQNITLKEMVSHYEKIARSAGKLKDEDKGILDYTKQLSSTLSTINTSIQQRLDKTATAKDLSKTITHLSENLVKTEKEYNAIQGDLNKKYRDSLKTNTDLLQTLQQEKTALNQATVIQDQAKDRYDQLLQAKMSGQRISKAQLDIAKMNLDNAKEDVEVSKKLVSEITQKQKEEQHTLETVIKIKQTHADTVAEAKKELELAKKKLKVKQAEETLNKVNQALGFTAVFTFEKILEATFKAQKQIAELGRSLGVSREEADKLRDGMQQYSNASKDSFVTVERLVKAQAGLTEQLGIAVDFGNEERETFAKLTELTGLTADEAGKLAKVSAVTGTTTRKYVSDLRVAGMEAARANKIHLSDKELLSSIGKLSAGILVKFQNNPKALAAAVVEAKKLGTSLEQVDKIGDSLLDWQSSIQNELEAELLTNRKLNFEAARYAALTGNQTEVMREMAKQAGSLNDFQNMNVIAQNSLAKAFGVSRDEMADMLMKQEAINKYGDAASKLNADQLKDMEAKNMSAEEYLEKVENQRSAQENFNDAVVKLQELLGTLLEGPIGKILDAFTTVMHYSVKIGESLGGLSGILLGLIPILLKGSAIMRVFAVKGFQAGVSAIFQSFAKIPFGLGIPLAIAAVAGLSKLFSSKGDDIVSEGGYGKRTLFGPEGAIALNDKDTVIAGTDLFKKGDDVISSPKGAITMPNMNTGLLKQQQRTNELLEQSLNRPAEAFIAGENPFIDNISRNSRFGTNQAQRTYGLA